MKTYARWAPFALASASVIASVTEQEYALPLLTLAFLAASLTTCCIWSAYDFLKFVIIGVLALQALGGCEDSSLVWARCLSVVFFAVPSLLVYSHSLKG